MMTESERLEFEALSQTMFVTATQAINSGTRPSMAVLALLSAASMLTGVVTGQGAREQVAMTEAMMDALMKASPVPSSRRPS